MITQCKVNCTGKNGLKTIFHWHERYTDLFDQIDIAVEQIKFHDIITRLDQMTMCGFSPKGNEHVQVS